MRSCWGVIHLTPMTSSQLAFLKDNTAFPINGPTPHLHLCCSKISHFNISVYAGSPCTNTSCRCNLKLSPHLNYSIEEFTNSFTFSLLIMTENVIRLMRWLNPLSHKAVLNTVMVFLSFFYKKKHHRDTKAGCLLTWSWSLCNLIMQRSTLPLYLQYCWHLQSFGFGQFSPQCRQHPCECRWPNWSDSPRSPASSWNTMMSKLKVEIFC